jgi:very-short-patch-repair endonuclease
MIIELDGDSHGDYSKIQKDEVRDKYFEKQGYKVIRFENRFVFQDPELVLNTIKKNFKCL